MGNKKKYPVPPGYTRAKGFTHAGARQVFAPSPEIRMMHAEFLNEAPEIKWTSPLEMIKPHLKKEQRFFLKADISSAFDGVTYERMAPVASGQGIFYKMLRRGFFHEDGGLIQGAPASPYLFEVYCRFGGLDESIHTYCQKENETNSKGYIWTRYVDDLLVSAPNPIGRSIGPRMRKLLLDQNFLINDNKMFRRDSFLHPVEHLGAEILHGKVRPKPETLRRLEEKGLSAETIQGLHAWCKQINALNC